MSEPLARLIEQSITSVTVAILLLPFTFPDGDKRTPLAVRGNGNEYHTADCIAWNLGIMASLQTFSLSLPILQIPADFQPFNFLLAYFTSAREGGILSIGGPAAAICCTQARGSCPLWALLCTAAQSTPPNEHHIRHHLILSAR